MLRMIKRLGQIKIKRPLVVILAIAIIIFVEIIIMAPGVLEKVNPDAIDPSTFSNSAEGDEGNQGIDQKMMGVHLVENGKDEKAWELFANEATGSADGQWVLTKVKVQFFADNKSSYTVTGDHGEVAQNKDMVITGRVVTTSSNGYSFQTNTLRYMAAKKLMTSVDKVLMKGPADKSGPGFVLTGEKFLVDMVKNKMSILDKVVANKTINQKPFKLTSVRADFSNKNQEATFSGQVKMRLGTTQVLSPYALFLYSNQRKTLETIIMRDDVEFSDEDKKGYCKELEFDLLNNKMTMRGQPKVVQGEDEISGHEIVFIEGGKKVKINKQSTQPARP